MKSLGTFLRVLILFICLACNGEAEEGLSPKKPNFVVFLVDDLGWNHLSSPGATMGTGKSFFQTPNIDRLAASGVSFSYCYAQPNCAPLPRGSYHGPIPSKNSQSGI